MDNPVLSTISVLIQQNRNLTLISALYYELTSTDALRLQRRHNLQRNHHYIEVTIPNYTLDDFRSHFRLSRTTFEFAVQLIAPLEEYNNIHGPLPDVQRDLLQFLWYIGNLESIRSMSDRFNVSKSSFHKSMKRTASALLKKMPEIVKWPNSEAEVQETSQRFGERSQFQTILGAIDGSHIAITAPKQLPHAYFNRKRFYSVVLLASCNSNMEFNYVWTGNPGSCHDATVLRSCDLFTQSSERVRRGYVIVGDSAFPILRWLITPFRDHGNLTREQKRFNKAHSSCRVVIERAFGLLKCRFRRLLRFEFRDFEVLVNSILAACVLHNICFKTQEECDFPNENNMVNLEENDIFERNGHELQGIQIRQQMMNQMLNLV